MYVYVVLASVCTFDMRHSLLQGSTKELSSSLQKGVSKVGVYVLMVLCEYVFDTCICVYIHLCVWYHSWFVCTCM